MAQKKFKPVLCQTNGEGHWTRTIRNVLVTSFEKVGNNLYEARFDTKTWNVKKHGLIYTDPQFLEDLQKHLTPIYGKNAKRLDYTEQGMQGIDFVSLEFLHREVIQEKPTAAEHAEKLVNLWLGELKGRERKKALAQFTAEFEKAMNG